MRIVSGLLPGAGRGAFDAPAYVTASARHTRAEPVLVETGGAALALLRDPAGALRTVYGYPHPHGDAAALGELAAALAGLPDAWLALAPFGAGADLAAAILERRAPESERPILVHDLSAAADPLDSFASRARRAARTAGRRGAEVGIARLEPWFGPFYRAAMGGLGADPLYLFGDDYFAGLAALDHVVVTVGDEHGPAAAMLWLFDSDAGWYHLGGRRVDPPGVVGAMVLATLEGLRETARRGVPLGVLGGGRGTDAGDPLFVFKAQMATRDLRRPVFRIGGPGPA